MRNRGSEKRPIARKHPRGFSLLELMIALVILLSITSIVMRGMMQMILTQGTIANRTEMHSSVRSATEVLQQEIGQAGKIALPTTPTAGPTKMTTVVALGADPNVPVTVPVVLDSVAGVYNGMLLVIDTGDSEETVAVTGLVAATKTFTGTFMLAHALNVPVRVSGVYSSGIVPTTLANGSDGFHLKMYGDINSDGSMVYVEYICDTANGFLYRSVAKYNDATPGTKQVILPNLQPNPSGANCFDYQEVSKGANTYDIDVAVTLTVQTQNIDPQTKQLQKETKALLNVSPRNIFEGYQLAAAGVTNRIQPMPATVANLITQTPQ